MTILKAQVGKCDVTFLVEDGLILKIDGSRVIVLKQATKDPSSSSLFLVGRDLPNGQGHH
jgi:hypothetical protein